MFGRGHTSTRLASLLAVVVSAVALGVPAMVSAADVLSATYTVPRVADAMLGVDPVSVPRESDTPFDEAEPASDPNPTSEGGEEVPEYSDGEAVFVDGRGIDPIAERGVLPVCVASSLAAREDRLVSQFDPDGLERPPRV